MTLDELIDQQIHLGHKDPHDFPTLLARAVGDDLYELAKPHLDDFISEMARHKLGTLRRASIAKITPTTIATREIMLQSLWVPSQDGTLTYKAVGQLTAADFEARADYLERMAQGIHRHADWCRDCAQAINDEGVTTASELSHIPELPPLHE